MESLTFEQSELSFGNLTYIMMYVIYKKTKKISNNTDPCGTPRGIFSLKNKDHLGIFF